MIYDDNKVLGNVCQSCKKIHYIFHCPLLTFIPKRENFIFQNYNRKREFIFRKKIRTKNSKKTKFSLQKILGDLIKRGLTKLSKNQFKFIFFLI